VSRERHLPGKMGKTGKKFTDFLQFSAFFMTSEQ